MWKDVINRLGEFVEGEDARITRRRQEKQHEVEEATMMIDDLNKLHDEVTKCRTNPDRRIIGFVLHTEPVVFSDEPNGYPRDWGFIQLYKEKFDWDTFCGNKVYVGTFPSSSGSFSFG